ncbi:hypothetical protein [Hymenobacter koreensis]|uniref:Uncharacterized protein n=1 Tax=Hymenobacter koreensis TaxID=1084523 RepID=A0ABP8JKQ0_9BACT
MSAAEAIVRPITTDEPSVAYQRKGEPIRNAINQLKGLAPAAKAILIEACWLYENGGKQECHASNEHFASVANCHANSASRHLVALDKIGVLKTAFPKGDFRFRTLTPSPELRRAYTTGNTEALNTLLKGSKHPVESPLNIVSKALSTQCLPTTVITTEQKTEETLLLPNSEAELREQLNAATAALAAAKAEIEELVIKAEIERNTTRDVARQLTQETEARMKAEDELVAAKKKANDWAAKKNEEVQALKDQLKKKSEWVAKMCLMADSPLADFSVFEQQFLALKDTRFARADLQHYHEALLSWSKSKGEKRIDWVEAVRGSMRRDLDKGQLVIHTAKGTVVQNAAVAATGSNYSPDKIAAQQTKVYR